MTPAARVDAVKAVKVSSSSSSDGPDIAARTAAASRMAVPVTYRSSLVTRAPLPHEGGT